MRKDKSRAIRWAMVNFSTASSAAITAHFAGDAWTFSILIALIGAVIGAVAIAIDMEGS